MQCKRALQDKNKPVTPGSLALKLFKSPETEWPFFGWVHQNLRTRALVKGPARRQLLEEAQQRNDRTE